MTKKKVPAVAVSCCRSRPKELVGLETGANFTSLIKQTAVASVTRTCWTSRGLGVLEVEVSGPGSGRR